MGFYLSTPFSMVDFLLPSLPEGTARNSKQKIAMPATQPTLLAKARGQSTSLHFDVGNPDTWPVTVTWGSVRCSPPYISRTFRYDRFLPTHISPTKWGRMIRNHLGRVWGTLQNLIQN